MMKQFLSYIIVFFMGLPIAIILLLLKHGLSVIIERIKRR